MIDDTIHKMTKITVKLYTPMYLALDRQLAAASLRRDAFLNRMINQEISHLREDLKGRRLSNEANRHIAMRLKRLGGKDTPPLKQVSIAVQHETAEALRAVVDEHNLVRDAFLNRLIALLRGSDKLLDALGLPKNTDACRSYGVEGVHTSPMHAISELLADPLYYLRIACKEQYGCGLYLLEFPEQYIGLTCYIDDEELPGRRALSDLDLLPDARDPDSVKQLIAEMQRFESTLSPIKRKGV